METITVSDQATDADKSRLSKYKLNFVILFQIYSPCAILTAGILILMVTFVDFRGASHDLCLRSTGFLRTSRTEGSSAIEMLVLRSSWSIFYAIPTNLRHTSYFQICLVFFFFSNGELLKKRGRWGLRWNEDGSFEQNQSKFVNTFCPPPPHLRPAVLLRWNESIRRFTCFHLEQLFTSFLCSSSLSILVDRPSR